MWPTSESRDKLNIFRSHCEEYEAQTIYECLEDMDYQDNFPEDMCEGRTDWDTLKERLYTAHYAVDYLIDIIERLLENAPKEETECTARNVEN